MQHMPNAVPPVSLGLLEQKRLLLMGRWKNIEPNIVRKSFRDHPWLFAYYCEPPADREDAQWYHALIFRDDHRSAYGAFELTSGEVNDVNFQTRFNLRNIATRVVTDENYRKTLLSESPHLPVIWRKH